MSSLTPVKFQHHEKVPGKDHLTTVSHSPEEIRDAGITNTALSVIFSNNHCPVCQKKIAEKFVYKATVIGDKEKTISLNLETNKETIYSHRISTSRAVSTKKSSRKRRRSRTPETPIELRASKAPRTTSPSVSPQREDSSSISSSSSSSSSSVTTLRPISVPTKMETQKFMENMTKSCFKLLERKKFDLYQKPSNFTEAFWATEEISIGDYILGIGEDEFVNSEEIRLKKEVELLENFKSKQYDAMDKVLLEQMIQAAQPEDLEFLQNLRFFCDPALLN